MKETISKITNAIRHDRRPEPQALILMYHRVAHLPPDPYRLTVSPENFTDHMAYLSTCCRPLFLSDLAEALEKQQVPERAVVVTFDDGYANNFRYGLPILENANVPATIFVMSGALDSDIGFWWDELERLLLHTPTLPASLILYLDDRACSWSTVTDEERLQAFRVIHRLLRALPVDDRARALTTIRKWADGEPTADFDPDNYRPLTSEELRELSESECIEIGGHTMTHPLLGQLDRQHQRVEIETSCQRLAATVGAPVDVFSYPYGSFNDDTLALGRDLGLKAAVTTEERPVHRGDDRLCLPRVNVVDWKLDIFQTKIDDFFAGS